MNTNFRTIFYFFLIVSFPLVFFLSLFSINLVKKASNQEVPNIIVNSDLVYAPLQQTWKAIAQGGEEQGVSMVESVVEQTQILSPKYIRLDHLYDFYSVAYRNENDELYVRFDELDNAICDITRTGARPFLSLGYMPAALSSGGLTDPPRDWDEWTFLVQKTIEHYSGNTPICGEPYDQLLSDIYYEVWNEPDLPTFGGWSIHGGNKDYRQLYYYSAKGAEQATAYKRYFIGGPATTAPYQNWMQKFLDYISYEGLRLDFISWHRYGQDPNIYQKDVYSVDAWLSNRAYEKYIVLPKVISEWGFDSEPNPLSETDMAAAHTIHAIRNLVDQKLELAFMFELKDGPSPSWGILGYNGEIKPRYTALLLLNDLKGKRVQVTGETSYIKSLASKQFDTTTIILSNYDRLAQYSAVVPVTIQGLEKGKSYMITEKNIKGEVLNYPIVANSYGEIMRLFDMQPNTIISLSISPIIQ
jgi:hypothetical protein